MKRTRRSLPEGLTEPDGQRFCLNHGVLEPVADFNTNKIGRGGYMHSCRTSMREYYKLKTANHRKPSKSKGFTYEPDIDAEADRVKAAIESGDIKARRRPKDSELVSIPLVIRLTREQIGRILADQIAIETQKFA